MASNCSKKLCCVLMVSSIFDFSTSTVLSRSLIIQSTKNAPGCLFQKKSWRYVGSRLLLTQVLNFLPHQSLMIASYSHQHGQPAFSWVANVSGFYTNEYISYCFNGGSWCCCYDIIDLKKNRSNPTRPLALWDSKSNQEPEPKRLKQKFQVKLIFLNDPNHQIASNKPRKLQCY